MFGTTNYTGGVEVYQFYSYDWYNTKTGKMVAYSGVILMFIQQIDIIFHQV